MGYYIASLVHSMKTQEIADKGRRLARRKGIRKSFEKRLGVELTWSNGVLLEKKSLSPVAEAPSIRKPVSAHRPKEPWERNRR